MESGFEPHHLSSENGKGVTRDYDEPNPYKKAPLAIQAIPKTHSRAILYHGERPAMPPSGLCPNVPVVVQAFSLTVGTSVETTYLVSSTLKRLFET